MKTSIGWKINENSLVNGLRAGFSIEVKDIIFEYGFTNTSEFAKPVHKIAVKYLFSTQPVYKTYKEYAIKQLITAKEYLLRGEYTVAKNIVEDILKIYPEYPDAVLLKERIENELTGITTAKQNYVEKIVKRINESIQKNNLFEAKRYYNILLEIDRYNPLIPHIEEEIKNLEKSFQEEKTKKQYSKEIEKLYNEAVEYSDKKEYEKAKEKFEEILKIYPEHKQAQEYISKIDSYLAEIEAQKIEEEVKKAKQLYEEGKYTQALDMFQSLKTKLPQRTDLDEYIENCKRKIEETKVTIPQVPKFAPKRKDLEDKFNEAMKLYDNKEYEKSIVVFKEVIKLSEKYKDEETKRQAQNYIILANEFIAKNYFTEGLKKEQEGDLETSYEFYKKSLGFNPNNPSLKQKLEDIAKTLSEKYYNEGIKFFLQNDSQKAKENLQKSLYYYENENARKALERIK
jgi:tetratricopeptide (TPR) repeat protein